jgi:hypothetical protein
VVWEIRHANFLVTSKRIKIKKKRLRAAGGREWFAKLQLKAWLIFNIRLHYQSAIRSKPEARSLH